MSDVYVDWYSDVYGQSLYVAPQVRQPVALARRGGRLVQVRLGRSVQRGVSSSEGWVRVSATFDADEAGLPDTVDAAAASVWAAHSADPDATLALHLDVALQDAGFRRIGGTPIRDGWEG